MVSSKSGVLWCTILVDWNWEFSIFVSLCLIRFKDSYNQYLFSYFFQSNIINQQLVASSKQSTVTNLHLDKIRELILIKPPIQEQHQTVNHLDQETKKIDTLIKKENQRTDLLKEYRQALISEVVTGKVDIRNKISSIE